MTIVTNSISNFEDLSDEIIITIIEYLSLEDFSLIFGKLNTRLSYIIFDHPWTHHQLDIKKTDNDSLKNKIDYINNINLTSRISSITIHPFSIYHSIHIFNQFNPLYNFVNLQALSLTAITLEEAESIFTIDYLSKLIHLTRLRLIFSLSIEENDYSRRIECLISQILIHPSLRHFTIETGFPLEFSQIQSSSLIEYLDIHYCSFQSLYTLFEFTPSLRHLIATIAVINESKEQQISIFPQLNTLKLNLSIPCFNDLTTFLQKFPKLQKLIIVTFSVIETPIYTSSWYTLITQYLPGLIKFKRESNVTLENIADYIQSFHWPNGWQLKEKSVPNGLNYSRIKIINTRY